MDTASAELTSLDHAIIAEFDKISQSGHWLGNLITDLINAHKLSGGIDFRTAEMLLQQEKEALEKDLAIARRLYRLYPNLVTAEEGMHAFGVGS